MAYLITIEADLNLFIALPPNVPVQPRAFPRRLQPAVRLSLLWMGVASIWRAFARKSPADHSPSIWIDFKSE